MQTSPGVAAILNPFAAAQGVAQASGQTAGLGALLGGLVGEPGAEAPREEGFGQTLDAALAAALGAPLPVQAIQAAPATPEKHVGESAAASEGPTTTPPASNPLLKTDIAVSVPLAAASAAQDVDAELGSATEALVPFPVETGLPAPGEAATRIVDPPLAALKPAAHTVAAAATGQLAANAEIAPVPSPATEQTAAAAADDSGKIPSPAPTSAAASAPASLVAAALTPSPLATAPAPAPVKTQGPAVSEPATKGAKSKTPAVAGRGVEAAPNDPTGKSDTAAAAKADIGAPVDAAAVTDDQGEDASAAGPDIDQPMTASAPQAAPEHRAFQAASAEVARATPQTVAHLAAQIANKVDGKATRFDVQLDPHGLGKVEVRVEISVRGDISAALTFENPHSAAELRSKAGELHTALEQAGFDLSKTSLSFSSGGQGQHQGLFDQQQQQSGAPIWRGRAFADLSDTPETAPAPAQRRAAAGGVDVRI